MSALLDRDLAAGMEPALAQARYDMRRLQKALHRGVGDRDHAVRARAAKASGVPESYLLRLHKRASDMTDVSGKYARLLSLAVARLDAMTTRADARREHDELEALAIRTALAVGGSPCRDGLDEAALLEDAPRLAAGAHGDEDPKR